MSRPRTNLRQGLLLSGVAALTTWVTLLTWSDFAERYGEYLGPLLSLALLLGLGGAALRWLRVPVAVVPLVQLVVTGWVMLATFGGRGAFPTPAAVRGTLDALSAASDAASQYAAPIPLEAPSVAPLLVGCGALALIAVDLLACGLGRVPMSGLALLMVYTLPVTIWGSSISWWTFVLAAAGFLLMLFLREDERFAAWGRPLTGDPAAGDPMGFGVRTGSARTSATAVGAVATAAALVVPLLVPTWGGRLFDGGAGFGGSGGSQVTIDNPITDLRRNLREGDDIPLLHVTTNEPDPAYLRYTVLTSFNGQTWSPGDRTIPSSQVARGQPLPAPLGVSPLVARTTYTADYSTEAGFRTRWLPVPTPAAAVTAPGVWKYDTSTMDFVSGDNSFTDDMSYSATGVDLTLTAQELANAGLADPALVSRFTRLPTIPASVSDLTRQVTAGQTTSFGKALALQDFFHDSGGFTYTLDTPEGSGTQTLATFLSATGPDGRRGYCEQFASAMAVMAREVGIPARVAVGFLRPEQVGPDQYVYSSHDLHAWPELYFEGAGWVRFEPTPATRPGGTITPAYTREGTPRVQPSLLPTANASVSDDPTKGASRTAVPSTAPETATASRSGGFPWLPVLVPLIVVALLAGLGLVPRAVRRGRRDRRLDTGTAEAAWAELRDTARDLGVAWPSQRSPRSTGEVIVEQFAAAGDLARPVRGRQTNPVGVEALDRLVTAVERERYAAEPVGPDPDQLRLDVETCTTALRAGVPDRTRRRADWLPASVLGTSILGAATAQTPRSAGAEGSGSSNAARQSEELEDVSR